MENQVNESQVYIDQDILDEDSDYGEAASVAVTVYCGFTSGQLRELCKRAGIEITDAAGIRTATVALLKETLDDEIPELEDFYITVR